MPENYRIDNLDQAILTALMENARIPYAEIIDPVIFRHFFALPLAISH